MITHSDALFVDHIATMCILIFVKKNPYIKNEIPCELLLDAH